MGGQEQVAALTSIAARDPGFDVHAFLSQAASTFLEVQRARSAGTPEAVADMVSGAARTQLGLDGSPGPRDPVTATPTLGELSVVRASTDAAWDSIVVRIPATFDGKAVTADWCFQRPATSTTTTATGTPTCSSCGAPRGATPSGTCRYCGAQLTPPNGWSVTRVAAITDPAPTRGQNAAELAGAIAAMMQAAAAAQHSGGVAVMESTGSQPRRGSRTSGCGCLLFLLLIVGVPAAILGYAAANPSSGLHKTLSFLPFLKRGYITGTAQLSGAVNTTGSTGNFVPGVNQCAKMYLKNKQLNFSGTMADGSSLEVKVDSLSGGPFGTYHYPNNSEIEVSPRLVTKAGVSQQWASSSTSHTSFALSGTGSGQLVISGYAPALTGPNEPQGTLQLAINWTCGNR
jgi:hypothetical protein